ncbi:MAG: hypothetical protein AAB886_00260 [Patescibacteria group bacterium]
MSKTNAQKKKEIDAIFAKYQIKLATLKKKRDATVSAFDKALAKKKIAEIKKLLQ